MQNYYIYKFYFSTRTILIAVISVFLILPAIFSKHLRKLRFFSLVSTWFMNAAVVFQFYLCHVELFIATIHLNLCRIFRIERTITTLTKSFLRLFI